MLKIGISIIYKVFVKISYRWFKCDFLLLWDKVFLYIFWQKISVWVVPCRFFFFWFSYIAGLSILWFCSSAAVKRFELILSSSWRIIFMEKLLISISSVKCSVSSRSFLVDHSVDVSPCFLITLKEIPDWLRLASPVDIYVEHNMNWGVQS